VGSIERERRDTLYCSLVLVDDAGEIRSCPQAYADLRRSAGVVTRPRARPARLHARRLRARHAELPRFIDAPVD